MNTTVTPNIFRSFVIEKPMFQVKAVNATATDFFQARKRLSELFRTEVIEDSILLFPRGDRFGKREVLKFIELLGGDEITQIDPEIFATWREPLMYAVNNMREQYESYGEKDNLRLYYLECWKKFDLARDDVPKILESLSWLHSSIKWE
jgi:hypothetical protein